MILFIVDKKINKLNEPISISMKNKINIGTAIPVLAWWDVDSGAWMKEGCRLSSSDIHNSDFIYQCDRLGYFSLIVDHKRDVIYLEKKLALN